MFTVLRQPRFRSKLFALAVSQKLINLPRKEPLGSDTPAIMSGIVGLILDGAAVPFFASNAEQLGHPTKGFPPIIFFMRKRFGGGGGYYFFFFIV